VVDAPSADDCWLLLFSLFILTVVEFVDAILSALDGARFLVTGAPESSSPVDF
jgi:hypothetical protein